MFTGLVEEVGTVRHLQRKGHSVCLTISAQKVMSDLAVDHSIAIDGVCLTVTKIDDSGFQVEAVEETLRKTNLESVSVGTNLNLERSLRPADRMGGHFVQGHVDDVGTVTNITSQAGGVLLSVRLPKQLLKYVISEGSITIDGVSLTVARLRSEEITISLIPHTLENTTLGELQVGDKVNIEVDLLGKYIERILTKSDNDGISQAWLEKLGYDMHPESKIQNKNNV